MFEDVENCFGFIYSNANDFQGMSLNPCLFEFIRKLFDDTIRKHV
jgi:hypothetical protein